MIKAKSRKCRVCKKKHSALICSDNLLSWPGVRMYKSVAVCETPECMTAYAISVIAKERDKQDKAFRAETKARKKTIDQQTTAYWIKRIHREAFNPWIRLRDKGKPCISCGKLEGELPGCTWDAGHFMSVGSRKDIRFEPDNCHRQCSSCNRGGEMWSHKSGTVATNYERNLIERIGQERVNELKFNGVVKRWRVPELKDVFEEFKNKLSELKNGVN